MTNEQLSGLSSTEDSVPSCPHHWVIQDSDGPQSVGVCRVCGEYKQFKNYLENSHWGDDKARSEARPALISRPSQTRFVLDEDDEF